MIDPVVSLNATSREAALDARDAKLKKAASQLEGVFVQQLFKAMRDTVPQQEGIVSGGTGEDLFTSLMDQHIAAETPRHWGGGIGDAVYRHLRRGLASAEGAEVPNVTETHNPIVR